MRQRVLALSVLLFFLSVQAPPAQARKAGMEFWHTEVATWKIAKDWRMSVSSEAYFDDDASHYYYQEGDLGFIYSGFAKWFDLSLNYKHVAMESKNRWAPEERPHFAGIFKFDIGNLSLSDRNRFEYRIREAGTDTWRYRNLLTIKAPWKFTKWQIQPYIADEVLIDELVRENRSYAGFGFKLTKEISAAIYYMQRRLRQGGGDWSGANIVGTNLRIDF